MVWTRRLAIFTEALRLRPSILRSREKVGEYEVLDAGLEAYFNLEAHTRSKYFDFIGDIKDKDDQTYLMEFDGSRLFQTETSYSRFKHYLDHDRLKNQDYVTDFDAGKSNSIIREEITSLDLILLGPKPLGIPCIASISETSKL